MATLIYLDTHVVAWLYMPRLDLLSETARSLIDEAELLISPAVRLELAYLAEIGRLKAGPNDVVQSLHAQLGLGVCTVDFAAVVDAALSLSWTRDPFDRLIVGHSIAGGHDLLTADATIRREAPNAIW
ncbi:MAG: type II toxin-antitoxin system VapC family toxin [Pseudonocardiaceae bacterium]